MYIVIYHLACLIEGFPVALVLKNPPAKQETQEMWVWSLGWDYPLEEEMATHSSILAWKISWTEEPGGLQGATKSGTWLSTCMCLVELYQ